MPLKSFRFPLRGALAAAAALWLLTAASATTSIRVPVRAWVTEINGQTYLSGELYLNDCTDTLRLKPLGFRRFEFRGRSVGTVRCHAFWPRILPLDSLPDLVHDINFDEMPQENTVPPDTEYVPPDVDPNPAERPIPLDKNY
jgi:hypothetical protein